MEKEQIQSVAFQIILHSGNARTNIHEALELMKESEFDEAEKKLKEANEELLRAHRSQTDLLQRYAAGESVQTDIIMVHAQDHLMNTMTLKEIALEMLHLHQKIDNK